MRRFKSGQTQGLPLPGTKASTERRGEPCVRLEILLLLFYFSRGIIRIFISF